MGKGVCVRPEVLSACGRGRVVGRLGLPFTSDAVFSRPSHRLCPRHVRGGLEGGAGTVGSGLISAEQHPQAGPATPLDDAGTDLAACRYCSAPTRALRPTPAHSPRRQGPVGTRLSSPQPLGRKNQSFRYHTPSRYC